MKFNLVIAALGAVSAVKLNEPWDKASLPDCPEPTRTVMDDGKTHVTKYPYVGATCKVQVPSENMVLIKSAPAFDPRSVEHCPDFVERMTLNNGKTRAVPYPEPGWNCNREWSL